MNAVTKTNLPAVLRPQSMPELIEFARMAARSSMVPKDYLGKPDNVVVAVQMGSEIGLAPMQALQNIAVIGGRPSVWGDAMAGLCRQSSLCQDIEERLEGDGDKLTALCIATRVGAKPITGRFSVEDAKKAGLWNKPGPWQQYPKRMLQMRARGFALRDAFPDVLRGLISAEEARDMPAEPPFQGTTIEHERPSPEAPPPSPAPEASPEAPPEGRYTDKWLKGVQLRLATVQTVDELAKVEAIPSVARAREDAPTMIREQIDDWFTDAYARVQGKASPDDTADDMDSAAEPPAPPSRTKTVPAGVGTDMNDAIPF